MSWGSEQPFATAFASGLPSGNEVCGILLRFAKSAILRTAGSTSSPMSTSALSRDSMCLRRRAARTVMTMSESSGISDIRRNISKRGTSITRVLHAARKGMAQLPPPRSGISAMYCVGPSVALTRRPPVKSVHGFDFAFFDVGEPIDRLALHREIRARLVFDNAAGLAQCGNVRRLQRSTLHLPQIVADRIHDALSTVCTGEALLRAFPSAEMGRLPGKNKHPVWRQGIDGTNSRRHAGAGNGSAKYCVPWTTFPAWNSIILTVR